MVKIAMFLFLSSTRLTGYCKNSSFCVSALLFLVAFLHAPLVAAEPSFGLSYTYQSLRTGPTEETMRGLELVWGFGENAQDSGGQIVLRKVESYDSTATLYELMVQADVSVVSSEWLVLKANYGFSGALYDHKDYRYRSAYEGFLVGLSLASSNNWPVLVSLSAGFRFYYDADEEESEYDGSTNSPGSGAGAFATLGFRINF